MNVRKDMMLLTGKLFRLVGCFKESVYTPANPSQAQRDWYTHLRIEWERVNVDRETITDTGVVPYAQRLHVYAVMLVASIDIYTQYCGEDRWEKQEQILDAAEDLQLALEKLP